MVNFLTLLSIMTDEHFATFFSSQQSYIENTFSVRTNKHTCPLTAVVCVSVSIPLPARHERAEMSNQKI